MPGKSKEEIQINLFNKGLNRLKKRKYKLAINFFSKVIKLNPEYIDSVFNFRGRAKYFLKDYKSALEDFSKSIHKNPKQITAWSYRGKTKFFLRDYQSALGDFSEALKISPDNFDALFHRGKSKILLKDYQSALDDFTEVIKLNPSYVDLDINTNENYQDLLFSGEKFGSDIKLIPLRESIIDFKKNIKLIGLNAKSEKQFLKRGKAKFFLMDYEGAFDDYSKGISLNPSNADSYLSRANASIKLKKYAQYKKDLLTSQKIFKNKVKKENDEKKIILRKRQEEYFKLLREKGFDETPRWTLNDEIRGFIRALISYLIVGGFLISFVVFAAIPISPSFFIFLIFLILLLLTNFLKW